MTVSSYQNKRAASIAALEPTTAKYLLDFIYFTRDNEKFRFYKKVSKQCTLSIRKHLRKALKVNSAIKVVQCNSPTQKKKKICAAAR